MSAMNGASHSMESRRKYLVYQQRAIVKLSLTAIFSVVLANIYADKAIDTLLLFQS